MTANAGRAYSDLAIPPGEVLAEEIDARGMSEQELAAKSGMPVQAINGIILGREPIGPDAANGLSRALGIDPSFWVNLETECRTTTERGRRSDEAAGDGS